MRAVPPGAGWRAAVHSQPGRQSQAQRRGAANGQAVAVTNQAVGHVEETGTNTHLCDSAPAATCPAGQSWLTSPAETAPQTCLWSYLMRMDPYRYLQGKENVKRRSLRQRNGIWGCGFGRQAPLRFQKGLERLTPSPPALRGHHRAPMVTEPWQRPVTEHLL